MGNEKTGPSLTQRVVAVLVLGVALWIILKLLIPTIIAIAWIAAGIVAIAGVIWAVRVLRS